MVKGTKKVTLSTQATVLYFERKFMVSKVWAKTRIFRDDSRVGTK